MGQSFHCSILWWSSYYFDRLGIRQWNIGLVAWPYRVLQVVCYRITLKIKFSIFYNFKKNTVKSWETAKPRPTVALFYSRSIKIIIGPLNDGNDGMIIPSSHHIILKIVGFQNKGAHWPNVFWILLIIKMAALFESLFYSKLWRI